MHDKECIKANQKHSCVPLSRPTLHYFFIAQFRNVTGLPLSQGYIKINTLKQIWEGGGGGDRGPTLTHFKGF